MEIYADILFFVNVISTFILLDLTARLRKVKVKPKRKLAASLAGGITAVFAICFYDAGLLIRLAGFFVIPASAFGIRKAEIIIFSAMSFVMSAVFTAIDTFFEFKEVYVSNGILYFNIPIVRFILVFSLSYAAIVITVHYIEKYRSEKYKRLKITVGSRSVTVKALVDSGNLLKEPVSGLPVIVCQWDRVMSLFDNIDLVEFCENVAGFKIRLVPYKTVGGKRIMCAFYADSVSVIDDKRMLCGAYIGITKNKLSDTGKYSALIGAKI